MPGPVMTDMLTSVYKEDVKDVKAITPTVDLYAAKALSTLGRPEHQPWLEISWPSNYQPDFAILKQEIGLTFGLFKGNVRTSGSW